MYSIRCCVAVDDPLVTLVFQLECPAIIQNAVLEVEEGDGAARHAVAADD